MFLRLQNEIEKYKLPWLIYVEPCIRLKGERTQLRRPDLVICNHSTHRIIGVVELKYLPNATPKVQKDLSVLINIARDSSAHEIAIENKRYRGQDLPMHSYILADRPIFAWCGIHRGGQGIMDLMAATLGEAGHRESFVGLHAETRGALAPTVIDARRWVK